MTMTNEQMKNWIDNASYESLLHKWRFAVVGDPFFQGEIGQYYSKILSERKNALKDGEHSRTSKAIGWEK